MILGVGRGDSALAHLGRAPARLRWFENYLISLQAYLRGDDVPFAAAGIADEAAPPVENLGLADAPSSSRIEWAKDTAKVPVEVAATGARVIRVAARQADRIMFALGAVPERLAWGIETARRATAEAGRDLDSLRFGAYVNLACHQDLRLARELARTGTGLFARFSVMHGTIVGPANDRQAEVFRNLHSTYDMNAHGRQGGRQTAALTDEFMDSYAVIGDAGHCLRRLEALAALGIDKIAVTGPNFAAKAPEAQEAGARFTELVMPRLR